MDAIDLLVKQHRELETAMQAWLDGPDDDAKARFAAVANHLAVHLASEEQVFYPEVRARRTEDILLESLEEHLSLKRLVADLNDLSPDDATFKAKFKVLTEQTEHHHKEEEEHLFPAVRRMLKPDELEELGQRMQALQQRLTRAGDPRIELGEESDAAAPLAPAR